ncbi:unnamed protein product [Rotaria socialis]|uniref:Uncharacterized protein n=2 Tax=Rotaria socialis TaxID=392032 RepID=A0A821AA69_9BILA|nr:unnamed protein product [Rotaria socialis]
MDTDSNEKINCCVDGCPSNLNNNSLCLTQAIEFTCENCTNKFCFTHFVDHMKKGEDDPKSNKISCNSTSNHVCSTGLAIISEALVLQPVVTSTPINLIEFNSSLKGAIVEDENHLIANNVIEVMDSNMNNQADILISNDVDSKLETTIKEKPYMQKPNQTVENTSISPNEQLVSIQLSFENKVNFKHKFLNNLLPDLKLSYYLLIANGDLFNEEIKSLSQERYIESSVRSSKKQKSSCKDCYREKQKEAASAALKQASLANAVAVIKDTFPFEYLTFGNQMRCNIEYELQQIEKQKEIEYKPVYDSTSFKIPEEHRDKINEWLKTARNDSYRYDQNDTFYIRIYMRGLMNVKGWKDISPIVKGLLIAPGKIILTDKYMTKIELDNNKPCIVCVNDKEGDIIYNSDTDNYWKANGVRIH